MSIGKALVVATGLSLSGVSGSMAQCTCKINTNPGHDELMGYIGVGVNVVVDYNGRYMAFDTLRHGDQISRTKLRSNVWVQVRWRGIEALALRRYVDCSGDNKCSAQERLPYAAAPDDPRLPE